MSDREELVLRLMGYILELDGSPSKSSDLEDLINECHLNEDRSVIVEEFLRVDGEKSVKVRQEISRLFGVIVVNYGAFELNQIISWLISRLEEEDFGNNLNLHFHTITF
jgi:hypothetical protein